MVSCSPLEPGPRPSNSSEESTRMCSSWRSPEKDGSAASGALGPRAQPNTKNASQAMQQHSSHKERRTDRSTRHLPPSGARKRIALSMMVAFQCRRWQLSCDDQEANGNEWPRLLPTMRYNQVWL